MADADPVVTKIDPARSHFITIVGRKGSGKSLLAHRLFSTYPYDKVVADIHADTVLPSSPYHVDAEELAAPLPVRLPTLGKEGPQTWRFVPDSSSPTYVDDLDRLVGLCYLHKRTCLWIDEVSELTTANKTPPNYRRALRLGRHRDLTLIQCEIRPINIDPLVIAQADYVYIFELPNPRDRQRVADTIGWDPKDLDAAVRGLPQYGYLRYDARAHDDQRLVEFPPLPVRGRRVTGRELVAREDARSSN